MGMIKCPECGNGVSCNASSCPSCGNPISMKSGPFGGHEKAVTVRPGFWHDPNIGAIGCLVFIVLAIIIIGFSVSK